MGLYEEPGAPPSAVDYIKRYMGAPTGIDVDALRQENEDLKKEREELRSTIDELNTRLTQGAEEEDASSAPSPRPCNTRFLTGPRRHWHRSERSVASPNRRRARPARRARRRPAADALARAPRRRWVKTADSVLAVRPRSRRKSRASVAALRLRLSMRRLRLRPRRRARFCRPATSVHRW